MNSFYRHSSSCTFSCLPLENQDLYSHEDNHDIEHHYIRVKRAEDQFQSFRNRMEKFSSCLVKYKDGLLEQLEKIKKQIEIFQVQIGKKVNQFLESIQVNIIEDQSSIKIANAIKNFSFQNISCCEMDKILNLTSQSYSNHLGIKMEEKVSRMQKECEMLFQKFARTTFKIQRFQLVDIKQLELLNIVKLEESTIIKNQNSNEISMNGLSDLLSFDTTANDKANKSDKKMLIDKEDEIVEQFGQETYFDSKKKDTISQMTKISQNKKQGKKESNEIEQIKLPQQSYWLQGQEQPKQQHRQIQFSQSWQKDFSNFMKIDEIDHIANTIKDYSQFRFSIRVNIVRLLYYFKIKDYLKTKFIGGDQTGVAVFVINYKKGLKAGDCLEMYDCQIVQFKKSIQIKNDCNFKLVQQQKAKVKANIKGIFLNEFIEEGIYYALNDKKCSLIRNIADQIRRKSVANIDKVIVKISFILNQWNSHIFCQVGDSSGLMLAYIKKLQNEKIKEGDVLSINKLAGKKGKDPSGLIQEQILYLDAIGEKTVVAHYLMDFLQVSQNVMSL